MINRRYLQTLSELIDRLSIVQLKEVFIPEHKAEYSQEIDDIVHDIQVIIDEIEPLKPHWKTLLLAEPSLDVSLEKIKLSQQFFVASLDRILAKTELHRTDYSIDSFKSLIFETNNTKI
jgi:hypothetical protein